MPHLRQPAEREVDPAVNRGGRDEPAERFRGAPGGVVHGAGNGAVARALHRAASTGESSADRTTLPAAVADGIAAARGGGRPLPEEVRAEMQQRLGADFSAVRIHDDDRADRLTGEVHAEAFTTGADVFFRAGAYDPASASGRHLLTHELTHVMQNASGASGAGNRVSRPGDAIEVQARRVADAVVAAPSTDTPTAPAPAVIAAVGLHPAVGNRTIGRLAGPVARFGPFDSGPPVPDTELRDRALGPGGAANDAKAIRDFAVADDGQKAQLMQLILADWWVGPEGEAALERCWASLPGERLAAFATTHPGLWTQSVDRGAEIENLPQVVRLRDEFRTDVRTLAEQYLTGNRQIVEAELHRYGLAPGASGAAGPPGHDEELQRLQVAARALAALQRAQEQARQARVGWRIGDGGDVDPDWTGRRVKYQVPFDPAQAPPLREDPGPEYPNGDVLLHPVRSYEDVLTHHHQAIRSIGGLIAAFPALFAMARGGRSGETTQFAEARDPAIARERLRVGLTGVLDDIRRTGEALSGGRLDLMDLVPLHDQLRAAAAPLAGDRWTGGFRRRLADEMTRDRQAERMLAELGFQVLQQVAFLVAPLTGGLTLVAILAVTATVSVGRAIASERDFQTLQGAQGTAVAPGTGLVSDAQVDHASRVADAEAAAAALAAVALGAAVVSAAAGRPGGTGTGAGGPAAGEAAAGAQAAGTETAAGQAAATGQTTAASAGGSAPRMGSGLPVLRVDVADVVVEEEVLADGGLQIRISFDDPMHGTFPLGEVDVVVIEGVPRARMGLTARATIGGVEHAVRLVESGSELSVTRHAIDQANARYARVFGPQIHAFDGQLGAQNLRNFRVEFGRSRIRLAAANPGWGPDELHQAAAQDAIRRMSFGQHRVAAGYADFRIDLGDLIEIDFGPPDGVMLVPAMVDVEATLRPFPGPAQ
ncbi:eCIS core domain-containing protein [Jidongwangia harbinensis]|uniref:eCIS core domain-containing protein n=1 Tax=Jidongwangia harbinensis TaxID=2878561 RepID=UPI001CD953ED|nr:DUF4157 domain-containing protein [Jidongwangia harbinensis]MCA2216553.1 DUF4157 domain-containing protein [Jidongwangia harbinensis]